jgi:hypothetical protein
MASRDSTRAACDSFTSQYLMWVGELVGVRERVCVRAHELVPGTGESVRKCVGWVMQQ